MLRPLSFAHAKFDQAARTVFVFSGELLCSILSSVHILIIL